LTIAQTQITAWHFGTFTDRSFNLHALADQTSAGDMIGVHMCVQNIEKLQTQLVDKLEIAIHGFKNRIDEHSFASSAIADEVGVSRRFVLEQLMKYKISISTRHLILLGNSPRLEHRQISLLASHTHPTLTTPISQITTQNDKSRVDPAKFAGQRLRRLAYGDLKAVHPTLSPEAFAQTLERHPLGSRNPTSFEGFR
jgi:hypothetical protein